MSRVFFTRFHHGLCYHISDHPLPNINLDQHLVPTGTFVVVQLADYVRGAYEKKYRQNCSRRQLSKKIARGVSVSSLKGKRVSDSPQRKLISKNRRQEVESVAESEIVPNWHVFVYIFGQEIKEKVENESKWVLFFQY